MVVAAVAAGAAAGVTGTAERAVADAYQALKRLLTGRYRSVDVEVVERQPQSASRRVVLAEELELAGAGTDEQLLAAAGQVLVAVHHHAPHIEATIGVQVREVRAGELTITDVTSAGAGVVAENTTVDGSFTISGIQAGNRRQRHPPAAQQ
ncbi:hypothetical protein [Nocardia sp. NPDC019255]|uniref:hypothetical protein n=1 Tax=Nocardia sp. NPDC019255 TaxID=3154591 RepID=UPI0033C6E955